MSEADELSARLMQTILRAHPINVSSRRKMVHISDIGNCIRQTFYKYTDTLPDLDQQERRDAVGFIFDYGNMFESIIHQRLLWAKLAPIKLRAESVELNAIGETDDAFIFEGHKIVSECKGTNRRNFTRIVTGLRSGKPLQEVIETYYSQLQGYLWSLPDLDHGEIIIGNRDMAYEDNVPPFISQHVDRDRSWFNINTTRMQKLKTALENKIPPEREYTQDNWHCAKACPFLNLCYGSDDSVKELNTPNTGISQQ